MAKVIGSKCSNFPNGVRSDRDYVIPVVFGTASTSDTKYVPIPVDDCELAEVQIVNYTADRSAAYTVSVGSAGTTLGTVTTTTAGNVAGSAVSMSDSTTLGSTALSESDSLKVVRGTQGSTGASQVLIVLKRMDP